MAGDEITASAWVKYMNLSATTNATPLINNLASVFGVSSSSTGDQLKLYNGLNAFAGTVPGGDHPGDDETPPKLFITILFFDKSYNLVDAAWDQVSSVGAQTSPTVKQPPHDLLTKTVKAPAAGYAYVFISNENPTYVDAYFDDVSIAVTPTPVIASDDYYPFGLAFNLYKRQNSIENEMKFQGQEHIEELELNWDSFKWRHHQPETGRFFGVDPLAEKYYYNSPYAFSENKVVAHVELEGLESSYGPLNQEIDKEIKKVESAVTSVIETVVDVAEAPVEYVKGKWNDFGSWLKKRMSMSKDGPTVTIVGDELNDNYITPPKATDPTQTNYVDDDIITVITHASKNPKPPGSRPSGKQVGKGGQKEANANVYESASGGSEAATGAAEAAESSNTKKIVPVIEPTQQSKTKSWTRDSLIHHVGDSIYKSKSQ